MANHCPICDSPHDTQHGVAVHMVNKQDDEHASVSDLQTAYDRMYSDEDNGGSEGTSQEGTEQGTEQTNVSGDGGAVPPNHRPPSPNDDTDCCSNPTLKGSRGERWEIDGDVYLLEGSDKVCTNCETLHEG